MAAASASASASASVELSIKKYIDGTTTMITHLKQEVDDLRKENETLRGGEITELYTVIRFDAEEGTYPITTLKYYSNLQMASAFLAKMIKQFTGRRCTYVRRLNVWSHIGYHYYIDHIVDGRTTRLAADDMAKLGE